jgi:hypothetical protein
MTIVMPTIDAEGVHGKDPFENFMLGEIGEKEPWGIEMQAKIFKSYGVQATFFLDVYEYSFYGEDRMKKVVETLLKYDQDIQLHTHPGWFEDYRDFEHVTKMRREQSCFDYKRPWMWCYTFDEQVEILEHGIDCLNRWGAGKPIAHRAGAYGLNKDTIKALKAVDILIDSSMFYGHKNCKETWSKNKVIKRNGILEIPVTGFYLDEYITFTPLLKWHRLKNIFVKTDIDHCESLDQLCWFLDHATSNNLAVMNLFMHSYSLLEKTDKFDHFKPSFNQKKKLENFLEYSLNKNNVEVLSFKQLNERDDLIFDDCVEYIPRFTRHISIFKKLLQKFNQNRFWKSFSF